MVGMVLYMYDGSTEWSLGGVRCKTGYIVIKKTKDIAHIDSKHGIVHGKLYKSVFRVDFDPNRVVASGFSKCNGQWKFNSASMHMDVNPVFQDNARTMSDKEKTLVMRAVGQWFETGNQNLIP